jgi:hypothetical protein
VSRSKPGTVWVTTLIVDPPVPSAPFGSLTEQGGDLLLDRILDHLRGAIRVVLRPRLVDEHVAAVGPGRPERQPLLALPVEVPLQCGVDAELTPQAIEEPGDKPSRSQATPIGRDATIDKPSPT